MVYQNLTHFHNLETQIWNNIEIRTNLIHRIEEDFRLKAFCFIWTVIHRLQYLKNPVEGMEVLGK